MGGVLTDMDSLYHIHADVMQLATNVMLADSRTLSFFRPLAALSRLVERIRVFPKEIFPNVSIRRLIANAVDWLEEELEYRYSRTDLMGRIRGLTCLLRKECL